MEYYYDSILVIEKKPIEKPYDLMTGKPSIQGFKPHTYTTKKLGIVEEKMPTKFISPVSYKKRETYYSNIRQDIPSMITGNPQKILEVGCAEGRMGELIKKKYHCEYIGLEINSEAAIKTEKRLDRVITADAEKVNLRDYGITEQDFDYIIYGDVLEHLYDPWTVLYEHKQFLKDNGHIIASIPNIRNLKIVESLLNGNWTYRDEGILDSTHLRFFTLQEIKNMFANCGYRIVEVKCIIHPFLDLNKIQGRINIDLPKMTIKNVSKEEVLELSTIQFIVKAQKAIASESAKGFKCSIIIPVFNQVEYTKQCLEALIQNTPDCLYEVIIVDNGSTDGTKEFLKCLEGDVKIITNEENLGFAKACNQGARAASGKYLVFLNNDTVPQPGWLEEMVSAAESDEGIGIVGSKLLFPNGTVQHAGVVICGDGQPRHIYYEFDLNHPAVNKMREFQIVTAACMLIKRVLFRRIGCFDEEFYNGYEDVDLCLRYRKEGYKVIYNPKSVLCHYRAVSKTEGQRDVDIRNYSLLRKKWPHLEQDDYRYYHEDGFKVQNEEGVLKPIREKASPLCSIIILTHNQLEYTKKCINSIFKHTKEPFELIVVDNGSTDGTVEYLEPEVRGQRTPRLNTLKGPGSTGQGGRRAEVRIEIIKNKENLGFAAGNNQGMAVAKGDYVLLMNNDLVVTPGWLERLIACAEQKPQIGIVGPMSNYVSGPQLVKEVKYNTTSLARLNKFSRAFSKKHAGQAKPFWRVVGFCMLIKRSVIEKIGGLDGRYGIGNFEDDDFSLRAALAGFESWIASNCFVHYFGSRTFVGAKIDYRESLHKNWEIFKQKWGIPADVAYGAPYDMASVVKDGFIPAKHYCPLMPEEYSVADGEKLFGMGDIDGAKRIFEKILSADSNSIEPLNNLGVIAFQEGNMDQAVSCFTRVLEIDESYFEAIENLGRCAEAQKDYLKAAKWFEQALKLKPDEVGLLNAMGNCFIQTEDLGGAREIYKKSLGLDGGQESIETILRELERMEEGEGMIG